MQALIYEVKEKISSKSPRGGGRYKKQATGRPSQSSALLSPLFYFFSLFFNVSYDRRFGAPTSDRKLDFGTTTRKGACQ